MLSLFSFIVLLPFHLLLKIMLKTATNLFILTMIICTIITYLLYNNYFVAMMVYYVVISLIMLDNFKNENREYQKEIAEKIDILIH